MNSKTKRLTLCALLCAAALTIFIIEAQLPVLIPVPGIKPGLSNIITLFALVYLSPREAFLILIARIILGSIFAGQPSTLIYSLSGGLICLIGEAFLYKKLGFKFIVEISIIGAMLHNTVQVCCASLVMGTFSVFVYLPLLIITAIITGAFCGFCVKFLILRKK